MHNKQPPIIIRIDQVIITIMHYKSSFKKNYNIEKQNSLSKKKEWSFVFTLFYKQKSEQVTFAS